MLKRAFDIAVSFTGLILLSPVFIAVSILIKLDSKGPVFYRQTRVGKDNTDFTVLKFRTMNVNSDRESLLTVGSKDKRITKLGSILRKYKLDEFPQLINVLLGDMTFVGPRPEVRKYVDYYDDDQKKVLCVKPGITDVASILYRNENEILGTVSDPEQYYVEEIMPEKIKYNLEYINSSSVFKDVKVIFKTLRAIWFQ